MIRTLALAALLLALAGCGGMTRAVGVLPNTLDDLATERERAAGEARSTP